MLSAAEEEDRIRQGVTVDVYKEKLRKKRLAEYDQKRNQLLAEVKAVEDKEKEIKEKKRQEAAWIAFVNGVKNESFVDLGLEHAKWIKKRKCLNETDANNPRVKSANKYMEDMLKNLQNSFDDFEKLVDNVLALVLDKLKGGHVLSKTGAEEVLAFRKNVEDILERVRTLQTHKVPVTIKRGETKSTISIVPWEYAWNLKEPLLDMLNVCLDKMHILTKKIRSSRNAYESNKVLMRNAQDKKQVEKLEREAREFEESMATMYETRSLWEQFVRTLLAPERLPEGVPLVNVSLAFYACLNELRDSVYTVSDTLLVQFVDDHGKWMFPSEFNRGMAWRLRPQWCDKTKDLTIANRGYLDAVQEPVLQGLTRDLTIEWLQVQTSYNLKPFQTTSIDLVTFEEVSKTHDSAHAFLTKILPKDVSSRVVRKGEYVLLTALLHDISSNEEKLDLLRHLYTSFKRNEMPILREWCVAAMASVLCGLERDNIRKITRGTPATTGNEPPLVAAPSNTLKRLREEDDPTPREEGKPTPTPEEVKNFVPPMDAAVEKARSDEAATEGTVTEPGKKAKTSKSGKSNKSNKSKN